MDAREEQQSLLENPIPQVIIVEPLTRVWNIDKEIVSLQEQIERLTEQRTEAMEYALDNAIEEDGKCKLVSTKHTSTPNRVINVDMIQKDMPKVYERIWDLKRSEVRAELDKFGTTVKDNTVNLKISQKIAEPALKAEGHKLEEVLESGGPDKVSYTYEVVMKK